MKKRIDYFQILFVLKENIDEVVRKEMREMT